jgi:enoyl-CoA hydratase
MMAVHYERTGPVAVVTIDRPERRNAVDMATAQGLQEAWRRFEDDGDALVGVLTGAGGTFSAGADLVAFDLVETAGGYLGGFRGQVGKPTIAAVTGYCVAGGLEMALWCDLRVAGEDAVFGCFERRWGVPLVDGGTQRLPRIVGLSRALDMILTGRPVDAAEALQHGLVNAVYEPGELREKTLELCRGLEAKSPVALAYAKEAVNLSLQGPHRTNLESEARLFAMLFASEDQKEGMAAFVEKRPPEFRGR